MIKQKILSLLILKSVVKLVFGILLSCFFLGFISKKKPKILMIGDSTMANKPEKALPENGWGMALKKYCKESVALFNYARNGRSTKSFINEHLWDSVVANIAEGDFVIVQFGHNDEKNKDTSRFTEPQTTYKDNLKQFINDTRLRGGFPILCTSIVRREFDKNGKLVDTHGDYLIAVRELSIAMNVPLVDLAKLTADTVASLGPEQSKQLFMVLSPNEHSNFPEGKNDNTHLKVTGAELVAELFVNDVKKQNLNLKNLFK